MFLQAQVVDVRSAHDVVSRSRQVTAVAPEQLTSSDVQNVAAVLEKVGPVLRQSPSDELTAKVRDILQSTRMHCLCMCQCL